MISNIVLGVSLVILLCVVSEKFSYKIGIPALIFFMFIGMLAGSDGVLKIKYENFSQAEMICSIGLIFIMFDGGFNTNWKHAKPYVVKSVSLSTIGVVLTAGISLLSHRSCIRTISQGLILQFCYIPESPFAAMKSATPKRTS